MLRTIFYSLNELENTNGIRLNFGLESILPYDAFENFYNNDTFFFFNKEKNNNMLINFYSIFKDIDYLSDKDRFILIS